MAPKMMMVAMVKNTACSGEIGKNPFNFQHFNLKKIALYREVRSIPGQLLTPNFNNNTYIQSYVQTMRTLNYYNADDTNGIVPSQWTNGYNFYAFDLTFNKDVSTNFRQICLEISGRNSVLRKPWLVL